MATSTSNTTASTPAKTLTPTQVVLRLREEAASVPCFNAVCHVFAVRERARQQVTLDSLCYRMKAEGYDYNWAQYAAVLTTLANLGLGYLDLDKQGNVRSLKNIRITLQSIGQAAVGGKPSLDKFTPDIKFSDLPALPPQVRTPTVEAPKVQATSTAAPPKAKVAGVENKRYAAILTVVVDGAPVPFELPRGLSTAELGILLADIYSLKS